LSFSCCAYENVVKAPVLAATLPIGPGCTRNPVVAILVELSPADAVVVVGAPGKVTELVMVVALPTLVIGPVKLALVVTVPAVNPDAVPVKFVATPEAGVPRAGVIKVGELFNTFDPVPVLVVVPVPPEATGTGEDNPVIVPPVIATFGIVKAVCP